MQPIDIDLSDSPGAELPALAEALSDRILRLGDVDEWKRVFIGSDSSPVRYEVEELTLLAADAAPVPSEPGEKEQLVALLGGEMQPSRRVGLLLSFKDAPAAVRAAITLQRLSEGQSLRATVRTCLCGVARFELDGVEQRRVVGPEIDEAEEALSQAARGVVTLSAKTYEVVAESLSGQLKSAVVATEMEDEIVTRAYIALTPHASAPMSTFAGLGLS